MDGVRVPGEEEGIGGKKEKDREREEKKGIRE